MSFSIEHFEGKCRQLHGEYYALATLPAKIFDNKVKPFIGFYVGRLNELSKQLDNGRTEAFCNLLQQPLSKEKTSLFLRPAEGVSPFLESCDRFFKEECLTLATVFRNDSEDTGLQKRAAKALASICVNKQ